MELSGLGIGVGGGWLQHHWKFRRVQLHILGRGVGGLVNLESLQSYDDLYIGLVMGFTGNT